MGSEGTERAWEAPLNKVARRSALLRDLQIGAPAALKLAQFILWSCLGHLFAVFQEPEVCRTVFTRVTRMLVRGPANWIQQAQIWHLDLLRWPVAPPHPLSVGFRRRIRLICRKEWWSILDDVRLLREGVFHLEAPIRPFLAHWFESSSHTCLAETVRVAVLGGLFAEQEDGTLRPRAPLRSALTTSTGLGKLIRSWLSKPGQPLHDGRRIIKCWLGRRMSRTLGHDWTSDVVLERMLGHFAALKRSSSPKFLNALLNSVD